MADKRIKILSPEGKWWLSHVHIDGNPIDVYDISFNVSVDGLGTVTLTFDAADVDLDIKTTPECDQAIYEKAAREARESDVLQGREMVAALRAHEKATGQRLLASG